MSSIFSLIPVVSTAFKSRPDKTCIYKYLQFQRVTIHIEKLKKENHTLACENGSNIRFNIGLIFNSEPRFYIENKTYAKVIIAKS